MQLDFLKKLGKKKIIAVTAAICLAMLIGYYFLFLAPVMSRFMGLSREIDNAQSTINTAELAISKIKEMENEIEALESKANFYSSMLPKEEEFPAVLESLSNMAQKADVKITKILPIKDSITFSEDSAYLGIYRQERILINAQCGYHQLGAFISALESAERFMEVSDLKIEVLKIDPKRHNVQLVVKTFILKSEDE